MLSRVADHLYWMSRYLERAEHAARLLDVHLNLMLEDAPTLASARSRRLLAAMDVRVAEDEQRVTPDRVVPLMTFDTTNPSSIFSGISAARENARQVRDMISSEMWQHVNRLYLDLREAGTQGRWQAAPHALFQSVKEGVQLFRGVTDTTMNHGTGWRFIQLGLYLERAQNIAILLDIAFHGDHSVQDSPHAYLEWVGLLKCATAHEPFCKVHSADLEPTAIAEFLLLDPEFPHSVRFAVEQVAAALQAVGEGSPGVDHSRIDRLAGRLTSQLRYLSMEEVEQQGDLHPFLESIRKQLNDIHVWLYQAYIAYPIETALRRGRSA